MLSINRENAAESSSSPAIQYAKLVGGDFFSKVFSDGVIVIPNYLGVSGAIKNSLIFHHAGLTRGISNLVVKEKFDFYLRWVEKYKEPLNQLRGRKSDLSHDLKLQLDAIIHLLSVLTRFSSFSEGSSQSLLTCVLGIAHQEHWLKQSVIDHQTVYYFSHKIISNTLIDRDMAMECFSLLLACTLKSSSLKNEITTLLRDEGFIRGSVLPVQSVLFSKRKEACPVKDHKPFRFSNKPLPQSNSPTGVDQVALVDHKLAITY